MLDAFQNWFTLRKASLEEEGFEIHIVRPPGNTDKNSMYVDIDMEKHIGRITLWETGECDQQIINVDSEETVIYKIDSFESVSEMEEGIAKFIDLYRRIEVGQSPS